MALTTSRACVQLRALDPELPLLASEVAVDIDNMLVGKPSDRGSMEQLADRLLESIKDECSGGVVHYHHQMDMATLTVLGEAIWETLGSHELRTVQALLQRASQMAQLLKLEPLPEPDHLRQARTFCVALSRAAVAYNESIHNLRSTHPFRR